MSRAWKSAAAAAASRGDDHVTGNGSLYATVIRVHGLGIMNRSQLPRRHARCAAAAISTIGTPACCAAIKRPRRELLRGTPRTVRRDDHLQSILQCAHEASQCTRRATARGPPNRPEPEPRRRMHDALAIAVHADQDRRVRVPMQREKRQHLCVPEGVDRRALLRTERTDRLIVELPKPPRRREAPDDHGPRGHGRA